MKKLLFIFAFFLTPLSAEAEERTLSDYCLQNTEINTFARVTSLPPSQNIPLTRDESTGQWTAIYELSDYSLEEEGDSPSIEIEISGTADSDQNFVYICESGHIVAIIPTYYASSLDEEKTFKLIFTIGFTKVFEPDGIEQMITTKIDRVRYFINPNGNISEVEQVFLKNTAEQIEHICEWGGGKKDLSFYPYQKPEEKGDIPFDIEITQCLSKSYEQYLGGLSYHDIYVTQNQKSSAVLEMADTQFGIQSHSNITGFQYALFPPLPDMSEGNTLPLRNLSVEEIRCLPLDPQLEFKKYFLQLPEVIQKQFDFPPGIQDESDYAEKKKRAFLVNYFNEVIPSNKKEYFDPPSTEGKWLNIFLENNTTYRYQKNFTPSDIDSKNLKNNLVSYYSIVAQRCGSEMNTDCWEEKYRSILGYNCDITPTPPYTDFIANPKTDDFILKPYPNGCNGGVFPTLEKDQIALLKHVGIQDPNHPKIKALSDINMRANEICSDYRNTEKDSLTMLQAMNAASIGITQAMADLDTRYEGAKICQQIEATNVLSEMMQSIFAVLNKDLSSE